MDIRVGDFRRDISAFKATKVPSNRDFFFVPLIPPPRTKSSQSLAIRISGRIVVGRCTYDILVLDSVI